MVVVGIVGMGEEVSKFAGPIFFPLGEELIYGVLAGGEIENVDDVWFDLVDGVIVVFKKCAGSLFVVGAVELYNEGFR